MEYLSGGGQRDPGGARVTAPIIPQTAFLNLKDRVAQLRATKATAAKAKVSLEGTRKNYEVGSRWPRITSAPSRTTMWHSPIR